MAPNRVRLALAGLLCVLVLAVFGRVLLNDFTNYDDPGYVTANPHVRSGLTAESFRWAWTTGHASNWHPLTWISHQLDWTLYGSRASGHHLTSLLLHLANTLLLFLLLETATGATWPSALAAALFGLHPQHVESVAWIAERKDVLSTFFGLMAIWAYVRWTRKPSRALYLGILVLYGLGLASKPMLVTLPFTLLLLDFWPLQRWPGVGRLLREKLPLLALSAVSSLVTLLVQRHAGATVPIEGLDLSHRLANASVAYLDYLAKTFWPTGLAVFYPHPGAGLETVRVLVAVGILVTLTAIAWRQRHSRPFLLVGWLWYLGTLVPVIGLIQVGGQARADRYTYVPLIGIFLALAWTIDVGKRRVLQLSALVIVALGVASFLQVGHWRDSETLYRHALAVTRDNWSAHKGLGAALALEGRTDEAILHLREALRIAPADAVSASSLGYLLYTVGQKEEGQRLIEYALGLSPALPEANYNLALVRAHAGALEEAMRLLVSALSARPEYPEAHNDLGTLLLAMGRGEEAVEHFRRALSARPDYVEALNNLGGALADQGRIPQALEALDRALALRPDYGRARANRAVALYLSGDHAGAWREVAAARRSGTEPPEALLSRLREKMPEPASAGAPP